MARRAGPGTSVLQQLVRLGWRLLSAGDAASLRRGTCEVILKERLEHTLRKRRFEYQGQLHAFSPATLADVVRQVHDLSLAGGLLAANEKLYQMLTRGVTVTEPMPDGKPHEARVALVDWDDVAANTWDVTAAPDIISTFGTHHRAPEIVGFVNGLPLAVIAPIAQQLRCQRANEIPQLYAYAQLLVSTSADECRYGTTGTSAAAWSPWREPADAADGADADGPVPAADAAGLVAGLLAPERLLEMLRVFVLFDARFGKAIARYHQFFGVRAAHAHLARKNGQGGRDGGVVWHAAGSGRRLSLVFLARALALHGSTAACRVVVATARSDVEAQLARNLPPRGESPGGRVRSMTARNLARRIGAGSERLVVASIEKIAIASLQEDFHNESGDIVVLVDEDHSAHSEAMHDNLHSALPNAACVMFTGTPLPRRDKKVQRYGPLLHRYSLQRAVEDATAAPLLCEERNMGGGEHRLTLTAWDIARHFNETFKQMGRPLQGLVACESESDADRYRRALDDTGLVTSALEDAGLRAGSPDLLICFDEAAGERDARHAVLYIDKPLKAHAMIRALARVNGLHEAKGHGRLVDYRGALKALHVQRSDGFDPDDLAGLYQPLASEFERLPQLRQGLWRCFDGLQAEEGIEPFRQVLMPQLADEGDGQLRDQRTPLRARFEDALRHFEWCLQAATASRGVYDAKLADAVLGGCHADLQWFQRVARVARQDVFAVRYGEVTVLQAREPEARHVAQPQAVPIVVAPASEAQARNETDLLRARLKQAIRQGLRGDPFSQRRFASRLMETIAKVEETAPDAHTRYALFRDLHAEVQLHTFTPSEACLGICRLAWGEEEFQAADPAELAALAREMDAVARRAMAELSLHPQAVAAAIRRALLPRLYGLVGIEKARTTLDLVVRSLGVKEA